MILQAFIFWVVDNFLKEKHDGNILIDDNDKARRYLKAARKGKYYTQVKVLEPGSDSEQLLSLEEDAGIETGLRKTTVFPRHDASVEHSSLLS